jgi:dihydrofolate reductase
MKLILVAAVAKNGVIGAKNGLPWYIPEDLRHFKQVTLGKTVLMGKNTYDSIIKRLGKPLPERLNVVVSRQPDLKVAEGVLLFPSLEAAYEGLKDKDEVLVMGGGQIYNQTIEHADKLILTEVHEDVEGDVYFPKVDKTIWKEVSREDKDGFSFVEYERNK